MEFVILFGAVIVGAFAGWHLRELHAMHKIKELIAQAEEMENLVEEPEVQRTKMRLERFGETIYAYEEDGTFIAQGKDLSELDDAIRKRFPEKKFSVQEDNLKEIGVKYHESV